MLAYALQSPRDACMHAHMRTLELEFCISGSYACCNHSYSVVDVFSTSRPSEPQGSVRSPLGDIQSQI